MRSKRKYLILGMTSLFPSIWGFLNLIYDLFILKAQKVGGKSQIDCYFITY